jgi:hypothetical protein
MDFLNTMVNNVSTAQHRCSIFIYILSVNTLDMFWTYRPSSGVLDNKTVVQGKLHAFL